MKTYNNFEQIHLPLGVIVSGNCNIKILNYKGIHKNAYGSNLAICPSLENIFVYNTSTLEIKLILHGDKNLATRIEAKLTKIAIGYENGQIKIWDLDSENLKNNTNFNNNINDFNNNFITENNSPLCFCGHTSSITSLDFDLNCTKLVSASQDNFIIIWDILAECGLFRLKGHTDHITNVKFMLFYPVLISCAKDKTLKFWDLSTQHCFSTISDTDFFFVDFVLVMNESRIITADNGNSLKIWEIVPFSKELGVKRLESQLDIVFTCNFLVSVPKIGNCGSKALGFEEKANLLFCLNSDSSIEVFKIIKKKKLKTKTNTIEPMVDFTESSCLERLGEISGKKLISFDIFSDEKNRKILSLSHKNNSITFHHIEGENDKDLKKYKISSLLTQGHRSPPNCISFNSNSLFFASGSSNEIKIWSFKHRVCTKTLPSENCMCLLYAPGDRYLIAGMESGSIYIYDAVTGDVDQCFQAHNGAINDIKMMPNNQGIASSSSDATVKFWLFDNEIKFSLKLVRQLDMDESVSCVCYSKCQKFIAVSALNDVKIFFDDTLKYYLTLYGHKLSVNSIDISHDNEILITASSDKNIKIWGLNFGECRKSIYAHTSQINKVCFIPQTHFFFSCGKDGSIKLWDGDSFKLIVELKGHHKEVLDFALNKDGDTLISVARDFSLRIWEQSDELIVPETIKEEENADLPNIPLVKEAEKEVLAHMKPTYSSLKYTESLVDSLDIHIKSIENPEDPVHPILLSLNMDPSQYVLHTLSQIPTNELNVSLTTLPYNYVIHLLSIIKEWMIFPNKLELCVRCVSFLIKLHFYQLMNSIELLQQFQDLYTISYDKVTNLKYVIGINMACLNILKRKIEKDTNKFIYDEYLTPKKK